MELQDLHGFAISSEIMYVPGEIYEYGFLSHQNICLNDKSVFVVFAL